MPFFRDDDHKFEFTREQFKNWAQKISKKYGNLIFSKKVNKIIICLEYEISFDGVGLPKNNDFSKGHCSQMAVFFKKNFDETLIQEVEKKDKFYAEEISSVSYPFEQKNYQNFLRILKQQYKFTIS